MLPTYNIRYSYRKTLSIRISRYWELIVSAPIWLSEDKIHTFVQSKSKRIINKIELIKKQLPDKNIEVTKQMKEHALIQILPRVEYYADLMNISHRYTDIKITTASTKRWSCSSRGILMFHWKLSQFPISVVDYVVVHELAHLIHFNHSKEFRSLVEQYHPEYKSSKKRLNEHWHGMWLW
jgi:predicted metal-dependent hydrolase